MFSSFWVVRLLSPSFIFSMAPISVIPCFKLASLNGSGWKIFKNPQIFEILENSRKLWAGTIRNQLRYFLCQRICNDPAKLGPFGRPVLAKRLTKLDKATDLQLCWLRGPPLRSGPYTVAEFLHILIFDRDEQRTFKVKLSFVVIC